MFKLIELIMRNNKLLINILANNFKPKDLRDVIEANNEMVTRFETDLDRFLTNMYNHEVIRDNDISIKYKTPEPQGDEYEEE